MATNVALTNGATISATTRGTGAGGAITVVADRIDINGGGTTAFTGINAAALAVVTPADLQAIVDILHTFDGDLRFTLVSPDGTEVILADYVGGEGDNFTNTTSDARAETPITDGQVPFTGVFRPHESFAALIGKHADGIWRLRIEDTASADQGMLVDWTLKFGSTAFNPIDVPQTIPDLATVESPITVATQGQAGNITVRAHALLRMRNGGTISTATAGFGAGGNITLTAPIIELAGGLIRAVTEGAGRAGTVQVQTGTLTMTNAARIDSSSLASATGAAGAVRIHGMSGMGTTADTIQLTDSRVLTRTEGDGGGGDIVLETETLRLSMGGRSRQKVLVRGTRDASRSQSIMPCSATRAP